MTLTAALVGFFGVLFAGYLNNFLAEEFRRFCDGKALAGALAGELSSHRDALPMIKNSLATLENILQKDKHLELQEWAMPSSPIFEANTAKIGLLGPVMAGEVAYVYENIRAFRQSFHMLSKHSKSMQPEWSAGTICGCKQIIERAEDRAIKLIETLEGRANKTFRPIEYIKKQFLGIRK